jgi:PKD repeat protein
MKLNLYFFLGMAALRGLTGTANAQQDHPHCGFTQHMQVLWEQDPQLKLDQEMLMQRIRTHASTNALTQKTVYTVPVVFHILHQYGSENIEDAQVYDALTILNADFRRQNEDISQLVAGFDTLATDANIEFWLATIDPAGNCTNGIEHIYSHETQIGDAHSKLHQWDRTKYVNIWVVGSFDIAGIGGYATMPTESEALFYTDGIAMLNEYIGSTGTGSQPTSRSLTHEMGHFLGLIHPWGNENGPAQACGDDGLADTPVTRGFDFCPGTTAAASICDPDIVENYQNFMEFSFCQKMFTHDQGALMRSILDSDIPGRSLLTSEDNITATGALVFPAPLCAPVADFSQLTNFVCEGDAVGFKDESWNAAVTSRTWYFQDGTPATSTIAQPTVTFSGLGWKQVKLIVSNATGTDSLVLLKKVHVSQSWADETGPFSEDFESGDILSWLIDNPENNFAQWQLSATNGYDNSKCMKLNNYRDVSAAPVYSDDYFYNFRLGGNKDVLVSPSDDLSNTAGAALSFDYAYASSATAEEDITESLKIYVSKNCGKNWTLRGNLNGMTLVSAPNSPTAAFLPNSNTQWSTFTIALAGINTTDTRTRIKFEFNASDVSNNLYLDNIRITGVMGLADNPLNAMDIAVFPNPSSTAQGVRVSYLANDNPVEFQWLDVQGKVLSTEINESVNTAVEHKLQFNTPMSAGCYYLKISQGESSVTKKVVLF